jgi:hypothetical protein
MIISGSTFLNQHFDGRAHNPRDHYCRVLLHSVSIFSFFFRLHYPALVQAHVCLCIMAYLVKARTAEPEKQPLLPKQHLFLGNGCETNNGTTAAARERLVKHVPAAMDTGMMSARAMPRSYKEDSWGNQVSSVWDSEERSQLAGIRHSQRT